MDSCSKHPHPGINKNSYHKLPGTRTFKYNGIMGSKNLVENNSNVRLLIKYAKYFQKHKGIGKEIKTKPNAASTVNKCEHRE